MWVAVTVKGKVTLQDHMRSLYDFSKNNNKLGLGLVVEHDDIEREYRFDIRINEIHLISEQRNAEAKTTTYTHEYTLDVPAGEWKKVGKKIKLPE